MKKEGGKGGGGERGRDEGIHQGASTYYAHQQERGSKPSISEPAQLSKEGRRIVPKAQRGQITTEEGRLRTATSCPAVADSRQGIRNNV
jgi:hypothetical protein